MKKTFVAVAVIAAILVVTLATTAAYLQYQSGPSSTGQLTVMGTDPPASASGVTDSKAHYSSVSAHRAGSDMSSGWVQVSGSGSIDLTATSGTAQTMATDKVAAGTYDAFRFNVDSVQVTYQGQEYMATVASTTLTAQSQSKVLVNSSSSAAAVVDMRTFIINVGNSSKPQFVFSATAEATGVPSSTLLSISLQIGASVDLSAQAWWNSFVAKTSSDLTFTATLSTTSFDLKAQNSGSADAEIQEVIVTPMSVSASGSATLPSSLTGSAVFTTDGSASMQSTTSLQSAALLNSGTTVSAGSSASLSYTGAISMNFGSGSVQVSGVVPGQSYTVTVIGANTYASEVVVAQ